MHPTVYQGLEHQGAHLACIAALSTIRCEQDAAARQTDFHVRKPIGRPLTLLEHREWLKTTRRVP